MLYNSLWVIGDDDVNKTLMNYTDKTRTIPAGAFVYKQEDERSYLFFLLDGRIKVNLSNIHGSEKTLAIHEPGSFFGETAFFDEYPNFTNAQAEIDSTVLLFTKEQLIKLFHDHPEIVLHLFGSMGRKIRLLSFQVEYLTFMKIEQRVVALLLSLFSTFGKDCTNFSSDSKENCVFKGECPSGSHLELTITDQEIADMIGARREAVTKSIANLKKQKLIYKHKRTICCPDIENLNKFLLSNN